MRMRVWYDCSGFDRAQSSRNTPWEAECYPPSQEERERGLGACFSRVFRNEFYAKPDNWVKGVPQGISVVAVEALSVYY